MRIKAPWSAVSSLLSIDPIQMIAKGLARMQRRWAGYFGWRVSALRDVERIGLEQCLIPATSWQMEGHASSVTSPNNQIPHGTPGDRPAGSRTYDLAALKRGCLLGAWMLLWLGGCGGPLTAPPLPSEPTAAPPDVAFLSTEEALPGLVAAEREASIARDLATLATLWAPDARIVDGRNTATADDDYIWDGRDAILDRYVVAVFPNPPPAATFEELRIEVNDQTATGRNQGDRWRFVFADGRWWLAELTYQQP